MERPRLLLPQPRLILDKRVAFNMLVSPNQVDDVRKVVAASGQSKHARQQGPQMFAGRDDAHHPLRHRRTGRWIS
jgi:hypothetical protein